MLQLINNLKNGIYLFAWFVLFSFSVGIVKGEGEIPQNNLEQPNDTIGAVINPPPLSKEPIEKYFLTSQEFGSSIMVLLFGLIIIVIEAVLIRQKVFDASNSMQFIVVTLVITSSLFLITAGFNSEQITPIIGLLGTIIGYLLGNASILKTK